MGLFARLRKREPEPVAAPAAPAPARSAAAAIVRPTHVAVRVVVRRRGSERPVAAVEVLLHPTTQYGEAARPLPAGAAAVTDGEGVARFLVPLGSYAITVKEGGHATRAKLEVRGRTETTVDIDAPPAGEEALLVRVRRGGEPARGEMVKVLEGPTFAQARTGDDGSCVLHLTPGAYRLACAGEEAEVRHRGGGVVIFALHGLPDDAWEPAPTSEDDDPFAYVPNAPPASSGRYVHLPARGTASARVRVE